MADMQTIPEFFKGRSIFITGATGFLGKVLIEKLLRSCPDVATIYILVRAKKGHDPKTRIDIISELPLFDRLKREYPDALAKIKAMEGDLSKLGLGLSVADRQILEENVSVVFHTAASVRFDDPLRDAILLNTRGTREIVNLAKNMKQLRVLLHVSTAYCNTGEKEVFEQMYPPSADWHQIIDLAESVDEFTLHVLTAKVLSTYPNTYTFTKSLAEQIINDYHTELPIVIVRPSVVVSSMTEPVPGWVDNFNGPMGLLVGAGKGIVHIAYADSSCRTDYIPVDICCKGFIVVAWHHAHWRPQEISEVSVYNFAAGDIKRITQGEMLSIGTKLVREDPFDNILYYPCGFLTTNWLFFYLIFAMWHILPAILVDTVMYIMRIKFRLLKVQRRIFAANVALGHFLLNDWHFHNAKTVELQDYLKNEDVEAFSYVIKNADQHIFLKNALIGTRLYLIKENINSLPAARQHLQRLMILHYVLCVATAALIGWLIYRFLLSSSLPDTLSSF